jgi:hypothetical protein
MGLHAVGIQAYGVLERAKGLLQLALIAKRDSQVAIRPVDVGSYVNGPAIRGFSLLQPALLHKRLAQIEVRSVTIRS